MLDDTNQSSIGALDGASLESLPPSPPKAAPVPREIWRPLDLFLFMVFAPIALLVAKIVLLIAYSALRPLVGWQTTTDVAQSNTIFLLVQQCIFYALVLV